MAIIVSKNGKNARKLEQAPPEQEDELQEYIFNNPDSLPLDDIKNDAKLLVVGREFDTNSGPIDVLALDGDGDIYIIETKLYKNPDKRHVIAQMLDYGAALSKKYGSGDDFLRAVEEAFAESKAGGLRERLKTRYGCDSEKAGEILEQIKRNLSDGNIKFVVLMDKLHERLRDLILFINQKSRFKIYAVEMEFYQHEETTIVIPRLYGAEVIKVVSSGRHRLTSEEEFFGALEEKSADGVFRRLFSFAERLGAARFYGSSGVSFKLSDPRGSKRCVTLFVTNRYGEVYIGWTIQQLEALELPTGLGVEYAKSIAALVPGVKLKKTAADTLDRPMTSEELGAALDKFEAIVTNFVQRIKEAAAGS